MQEKTIRTLQPGEILVNVERVKENTDQPGTYIGEVVLYKDARVDMRILDETYGPMNWKRSHQLIGNALFCTLSIRDPKTGEWIEKQDVGTAQTFESEKSAASDSFKRAAFNFGIGRELYTTPEDAFVILRENEVELGKDGRIYAKRYPSFYVRHINYDDKRNISELVICGPDNTPRYAYPRELYNSLLKQAEAKKKAEASKTPESRISGAYGSPASPSTPRVSKTAPEAQKTAENATTKKNAPAPPTFFPTLPAAPNGQVS